MALISFAAVLAIPESRSADITAVEQPRAPIGAA
jgi:hypothetical protein